MFTIQYIILSQLKQLVITTRKSTQSSIVHTHLHIFNALFIQCPIKPNTRAKHLHAIRKF